MAHFTDDTDLEKEAYFDISEFIATHGLLDTRITDTEDSEPVPDFVLRKEMANAYTIPEKYSIKVSGLALF